MPFQRCGLIGLAMLLIACGTHAEDRSLGGVPLPEDIAVQAVPDVVPAPARSFAGAWIGSWDGMRRHVLVVEAVQPEGTARVVSAIAAHPADRSGSSWRRGRGTIAGNRLTLEGAAQVTYILEASGTLQASYQRGAIRSYARLSKVAPARLAKPAEALDWSEPTSVLVTGPVENGNPARLEVVLFRPPGSGPFPLLVLNHGSTGRGRDPAFFTRTLWNFGLADFFVARGWMVAFPQRRGRGRSDGLYDEGFSPDRAAGYTCDAAISLQGAERALTDIEAAVAALRQREDVATGPILIGGVSRGGILSLAFAGRHPGLVSGVLNFVGGWIGTGCGTAPEVNGRLFREAGRTPRPTLWLYGNNDGFYPVAHSRLNFDAFREAGGAGQFLVFDVPGGEGHGVAAYRELWRDPVAAYLDSIGLAGSP